MNKVAKSDLAAQPERGLLRCAAASNAGFSLLQAIGLRGVAVNWLQDARRYSRERYRALRRRITVFCAIVPKWR